MQPLPFVLAASFIDLADQRQVKAEGSQALAAEHGAPCMEMCAKTGQGAREAFEEAVKLGLEANGANTNTEGKRCAIQ